MSATRQGTPRSIRASAVRDRELTDPWVLLLGEATRDESLREALMAEGYTVTEMAIDEMLPPWIGSGPDLFLLDLRVGGREASDLCTRLRQRSDAPIIVLAADSDESAIVRAVDSGADQYVTSPFGIAELLARARAALRRRHADKSEGEVFEHGSLRIDSGRHEVRVGRDAVHLTPTEYDLLLYLAGHAGRILTTPTLLRGVWGIGNEDAHASLHVCIGQLRRKIERDPRHPVYIVTLPGVGYQFAVPLIKSGQLCELPQARPA